MPRGSFRSSIRVSVLVRNILKEENICTHIYSLPCNHNITNHRHALASPLVTQYTRRTMLNMLQEFRAVVL